MLKKAGFVTSAVAGLMMIGGIASAGGHDDNGDDAEQVGLINVDDTEVLENVNVPICLTNNNIAVGLVAVAANILNPTEFDRCVEGTIWTGDEISD
ncbi:MULTISPECIES: hypothetical protein [Actinokineospora]|uniref:Secreted protein n=1 Tax=Actinokineospora fastidiosa TaxID=1816 RepID=A0A918LJ72_9PSEU|nr:MULTISPECIES: hypothetical protein [Actinokineospora]UVS81521.1 hypothetical protein Actkin_05279 [Actinokineospora sp. UTMC 2448]GGS57510.1 hypothetical protein GCM10010171_60570 [Actinokineospora fastidiosa]